MKIIAPKNGDKINLKEEGGCPAVRYPTMNHPQWTKADNDTSRGDGHEMSLWLTHYTTDPAQHILLDLSVDPTKQSCVTIPGKHRDGIDGGDYYRVWATRPDLKSWPPSILAESANFHVDNPVRREY